MRGFLSLEPDEATLDRLIEVQNRLRDAVSRQGVSFPSRLGAVLLAWPYATPSDLEEAAGRIAELRCPPARLGGLTAMPGADRPAEIGQILDGVHDLQTALFERLRPTLDPDPPRPAFVRFARVSPPSRKAGAALRGSGLLGSGVGGYRPHALAIWRQSAQGFEIDRTVLLGKE